jgi:hypothetical protein
VCVIKDVFYIQNIPLQMYMNNTFLKIIQCLKILLTEYVIFLKIDPNQLSVTTCFLL